MYKNCDEYRKKRREYMKRWYAKRKAEGVSIYGQYKDRRAKRKKAYQQTDKYREWRHAYRRAYSKRKRAEDIRFRLIDNLRSRTRHVIRGISKDIVFKDAIMKVLGCSREELVAHFEGQFKQGMNWDNYGSH